MASTMTTLIDIPYPTAAGDLELRIQAGACRLRLSPAEQAGWITGGFQDPDASMSVNAHMEGNRLTISVGRSPADIFGFLSGLPELRLQIGRGRPFALGISAGASESNLELGGLPLTNLELSHGAGKSASVRLSTAMASVEVQVPADLAVEVSSESLLGQPRAAGEFTRRGGVWLTRPALEGKLPALRIRSAMVMGQLTLRTVTLGH